MFKLFAFGWRTTADAHATKYYECMFNSCTEKQKVVIMGDLLDIALNRIKELEGE